MSRPTADEMHANYVYALGRITRLGPGGEAERVGPFLCVDAGLGVSQFNIAVAVEPVGNARRELREALSWFAFRGLNARLDLRSKADSTVLAAATVEGFQFWWRERAMLLHPIPAQYETPPELEMSLVATDRLLDRYCAADREEHRDQAFQRSMAAQAAEMSGVSMFVGCVDGQPVARSMAVVLNRLVGIHNVYVAPSQRGKGYGAAITAVALSAGRAAGVTGSCLEATDLGYPVYARMGFEHTDDYVVVGTKEPLNPR